MPHNLRVVHHRNGDDVNQIDLEELNNKELLQVYYDTRGWSEATYPGLQLSQLIQFILEKMTPTNQVNNKPLIIKIVDGSENVIEKDVAKINNVELLNVFYKTKEWVELGWKKLYALKFSELSTFILQKMK